MPNDVIETEMGQMQVTRYDQDMTPGNIGAPSPSSTFVRPLHFTIREMDGAQASDQV